MKKKKKFYSYFQSVTATLNLLYHASKLKRSMLNPVVTLALSNYVHPKDRI